MTVSTHASGTRTFHQKAEASAVSWGSLYQVAAIAVSMSILITILDIAITFLPFGSVEGGTFTVEDWFALLQASPFLALRNLGILNIITLLLNVPMYLALYGAHRGVNQPYAALAVAVGLIGIAIYIANNPALALLQLSNRYAVATTASEQTLYLAAGQTLLTQAEDFTPGAFVGFLVPSLGTLIIAVVMLRGGVFSKVTSWAVLVATASLLIFTVCATFIPPLLNALMPLAMVGGLLIIVGNGLIARRLLQLASAES